MKDVRRKLIYALFVVAAFFLATSVYCFWKAHRTSEQMLEKAWDEPSAILLLMDKADAETIAIAPGELVALNSNRLRNKKAGWILVIPGMILLLTGLTLLTRRISIRT